MECEFCKDEFEKCFTLLETVRKVKSKINDEEICDSIEDIEDELEEKRKEGFNIFYCKNCSNTYYEIEEKEGFEWRSFYRDGEWKKSENLTLENFNKLMSRVSLEKRLNNTLPKNLRYGILLSLKGILEDLKGEIESITKFNRENFDDKEMYEKINNARWHVYYPIKKCLKHLDELT